MNANYLKLEKGKQIGIRKRILKGNKYYWYSYAVQKVNICMEIDEYENIYQYYNLKDLKKHAIKYDIDFNDLSTLKGNRIFNPNIYK